MALTRTTTTAAIKAGDILIPVANTSVGFPGVGIINNPQQLVFIDNEGMFLVQVPSAGLMQVRSRGAEGTLAVAHDINAPVVTSSVFADFSVIPTGAMAVKPWEFPDVVSYGQSGAITVPIKDTKASFTGTSAQAMTLGAPSLMNNGVELFISSDTGFAHTITTPGITGTTGLFFTGAAGGPFTVLTFPNIPGASVILMAQNGLWNLVSDNPTSSMVFT